MRVFNAGLALLLAAGTAWGAEIAAFPRHPAVSPDGTRLAFSYGGDIWTAPVEGGHADRITHHPAYEHSPRWSPDGGYLAFSGRRDGNDDVFVIPADGGHSRRLTYSESDDRVCDWTADGQAVIFASRREESYPHDWHLYRVAAAGGTPTLVLEADGEEAAVSPDGSALLFVRGMTPWWQSGYRGSGAYHVWIYHFPSGEYLAVTDTGRHAGGEDFRCPSTHWPLWGRGGEILAVTDRDGTANLWRRFPDGTWTQLTHFADDGVRFPSASRDGAVIAFERGADLWVMTEGEPPRPVKFIAAVDDRAGEPELVTYTDRADRVAFTPDGRQMVLEVRGEIAAGRITDEESAAARGRAALITDSHPARDGDFTVSPGGDSLIFTSDRSGSRDLFLATSSDPDTRELARALRFQIQRLTDHPAEEHTPRWSPDGTRVAFVRGKGDLVVMNLATRTELTLVKGWSLRDFAWSPDGRWIAFSKEDDDYNCDVWIAPAAGGAPYNVSRHPDDDEAAAWSPDGRKLAFRSRRRDNNWDIYLVWLKLADHQKSPQDWADEEYRRAAEADTAEGKKVKSKIPPAPAKVEIDTTDLYRRVRAVTRLAGEEGAPVFSPGGKQLAFSADHQGETDLYLVKWDGEGLERLTTGGLSPTYITFTGDGNEVRFLAKGGVVKAVKTKGGKERTLPFEVRFSIDRRAERRQKFDEIWRTLNEQFYDPNFHGRNWAALRDEFAPWVEAASTEEDFADVMRIMFGRLNSSHMGYRPPHQPIVPVGRLGLEFDFAAGGPGFLVKSVVKDGPCDREDARIRPGWRVRSVAGVDLGPAVNLEFVLRGWVGQRVEVVAEDGRSTRRLVVRPIDGDALSDLIYQEWVQARRAVVDSLSGGRIGYLHLRGMGQPSLARFEAELFSVGAGKDALVVDVRYNGGGWTTDWLLAMLQVRRHAVTFPRDGGPGYPQDRLPLYSWTKPIAVLCNEYSFSNAEIFSHAVKTLGRGKLVGVPTPGGVISTGEHTLVDGSTFRVPGRGWFVGDQPHTDPARRMEGNGAVPDLIVYSPPGAIAPGADRQLQAAVNALMHP